jgi:hypothetical protein
MTHAYTVFAESAKKDDPCKRGRFNIGEKLILAICEVAEIISTQGGFRFDSAGPRATAKRVARGTEFWAVLKLTKAEHAEIVDGITRGIIPPDRDVVTLFNGTPISTPQVRAAFDAALPTVLSDDLGVLRRTQRMTRVDVLDVANGAVGMLYEMGIPVAETGDPYHYNVWQKVPLTLDRANVTPSFLRKLREAVFNALPALITEAAAHTELVRAGIEGANATAESVRNAITAQFGDKVVAYDPSDIEANKRAVAEGYQLIYGKQLSKAAWANVRQHNVAPPAGQVTPSQPPTGPEALTYLPPDQWTPQMHRAASWCSYASKVLANVDVAVCYVRTPNYYAASYGDRTLIFNVAKLGYAFFERIDSEQFLSLFIHELGHEYSGDHLSSAYYDALCDLGARLALEWHRLEAAIESCTESTVAAQ